MADTRRLRRAIHHQVCQEQSLDGEFQGICKPKLTPLFTQKELDRLVFVRRNADHYACGELAA